MHKSPGTLSYGTLSYYAQVSWHLILYLLLNDCNVP